MTAEETNEHYDRWADVENIHKYVLANQESARTALLEELIEEVEKMRTVWDGARNEAVDDFITLLKSKLNK